MKILSETISLTIFIVILTSTNVICQDSAIKNTSDQNLYIAAREIMINAGTCALITLDKDGVARARTMAPFPPEEDFTLWFGTNPQSRKVTQIKNDPRVTLYYLDNDASGYVIIHGTAALVDDIVEKEKHWKTEWEAFYPDKTDSYLLIKVSPIWMEVLSPPHGINNDTTTWQPPIVSFH